MERAERFELASPALRVQRDAFADKGDKVRLGTNQFFNVG